MDERPTLKVLMVRADWTRERPEEQVRYATWHVIDLLEVQYYRNLGYRVLGLDPITEAAWRAWRAQNPEAA
jgi:hypothetical protein